MRANLFKLSALCISISIILILALFNQKNYQRTNQGWTPDSPNLIFVGGHESSGTGLMRALLDVHPKIRCGAEPMITLDVLHRRMAMENSNHERATQAGIYPKAFDEAVAWFITKTIEFMGPSAEYLCHKQPATLIYLQYLGRIFPQAKFIHMIRDGRSTIASSMERGLAQKSDSPYDAFKGWENMVTSMIRACHQIGPERCLNIKYEKLVMEPERMTRSLFDFLGIHWDPVLLHHETKLDEITNPNEFEPSTKQFMKPIHTNSLATWAGNATTLSSDFIKRVTQESELLEKLGYSRLGIPPDYRLLDANVSNL